MNAEEMSGAPRPRPPPVVGEKCPQPWDPWLKGLAARVRAIQAQQGGAHRGQRPAASSAAAGWLLGSIQVVALGEIVQWKKKNKSANDQKVIDQLPPLAKTQNTV